MNHLVIMAKAPEAGRVKTRLARDVGAVEAARVYRTLLGGSGGKALVLGTVNNCPYRAIVTSL